MIKFLRKKVHERYQKTRNYQKLQLRRNVDEYWLLESKKISVIPKKDLNWDNVKIVEVINENDKQLIVDWRVGRYNRKPFPHGFNLAFLKYLRESDLSEYLTQNRDKILDLYVYVDPYDDDNSKEYHVIILALLAENCTLGEEKRIETTLRDHWEILHNDDKNSLKMR